MFSNVLLPIDLNHPASWERALPMAREQTARGGTLHILGIVHDIGSPLVAAALPEGWEKHMLEQMASDLAEFAQKHAGGAKTATHVGHGHVPEAILKAAGDVGADLIVMASHPPNDLRTLLVGSNADKVVHNATIPVLVVR